MLASVHCVTKAMAWHDEPIKLYTHPPSTSHLRAYVGGRNDYTLGSQSLTPEGEEVPGHPLVAPSLMGPT